jgi:hypothetical protein
MPRHPRIALTSRLRIHTINDKIGTRVVHGAGCRPQGLACLARHPSQLPEGEPLTQLDNLVVYGTCLSLSAGEPPDREEAHAATASISRTHSQCQRGEQAPQIREANLAKIWSSYLENRQVGGASRDRTGDLKLAKLALSQLSYGPA